MKTKMFRWRCVYKCRICRIYIPKKLQCVHFMVYELNSLFIFNRVKVAYRLIDEIFIRNQTHDQNAANTLL